MNKETHTDRPTEVSGETRTFDNKSEADHLSVSRLMDGYLITQLLYVAAKLNIADALAAGPQPVGILARKAGAHPSALHRVLRGLAAEGVLEERHDGYFGLTAIGDCLRSDAPDTQRGRIIARGGLYYGAAAALPQTVQDNGVPFERIYGSTFFEYLAQHPEEGNVFQASMADRARNEGAAIAATYDFARFGRLVDVGGGHGIVLAAILRAAPHLRGTLFDLAPVVKHGREKLKAAGLSGRCDFVAGNFFESVFAGGDAYLLARIIHDWDDETAVEILRSCWKAMQPGNTLLLAEVVLPERAAEEPEAIRMDLHMLLLLRGRERTAADFEWLLAEGGFQLTRILPVRSAAGISVIEAERVPESATVSAIGINKPPKVSSRRREG